MSHFAVVVRLPGSVAEENVQDELSKLLQPFHEFECTGTDDQYVQSVDQLAEVREEYASSAPEESFAEFIESNYGRKLLVGDERGEEHKFGWYRINDAGDVAEVIDRTNPNKKWDWWEIGGRWSGYFPVKHGDPNAATTLGADLRAVESEIEAHNKSRTGAPGEHERYLEMLLVRDQLAELVYAGRRRQAGIRLGRAGTFRNVPDAGKGDVVRKGEIDFDAVATATREAIDKFHGKWERFVAGEKFPPFDGPADKARRIGLLETRQGPPNPGEEDRAISWATLVQPGDDRAHWSYIFKRITRDELVQKYADAFSPISGYAYLDETGWHEPGRMGWFGCSSDTPETLLETKRSFMQWLKETPDDSWLVAVDCHI